MRVKKINIIPADAAHFDDETQSVSVDMSKSVDLTFEESEFLHSYELVDCKPSGRFCFRFDDDGHNYLIPVEMKDLFDSMLSEGIEMDDYNDFNDVFSEFNVGGCIQGITFENPKL